MKRLKVALMGLTDAGADYLSAICSDDQFDLVAVADTDAEALRRCAETTPARAYDDYRSLIVETAQAGLDLLFVALEPFQSIEFVQMAADRGIGIFHKGPFARNMREAQQLVRRFEEVQCPLVIARAWPFEPTLAAINRLGELAGHVYAVTAFVQSSEGPVGWRGDSLRAGGGVLLNGAYEVTDMLIHLFGPPQSVYARCSSAAAPGTPRKYDTEDVATVTLTFGQERIACVTAVRGSPEPRWSVVFIGTEGTMEARGDGMVITPRDGHPLKRRAVRSRPPTAQAIGAFGEARRSGAQPLSSTGQEHLVTMAAIEAAYLSARTGAVESPSRFQTMSPHR